MFAAGHAALISGETTLQPLAFAKQTTVLREDFENHRKAGDAEAAMRSRSASVAVVTRCSTAAACHPRSIGPRST